METVVRGLVIYGFLLIVFRLAGKRTVAQTIPFDLILLLIIAETTQQALVGQDYSVTASFILIVTLLGTDVLLSLFKQRFTLLDLLLDGAPLVLVRDGRPIVERLRRVRIVQSDILAAARHSQGLTQLDQIRYAVLERNGAISIVPKA